MVYVYVSRDSYAITLYLLETFTENDFSFALRKLL